MLAVTAYSIYPVNMARMKDESRRSLIMNTSKALFSRNGYYNTSISDIVNECGLPVGSIYTYFKSKEEIVRCIVEEGWTDLENRMIEQLNKTSDSKEKLSVIMNGFLPELFKDADLINILLSEALALTKIEEKIQIILDLVINLLNESGNYQADRKFMETALIIHFLGSMNMMRIIKSKSIDLTVNDIYSFLKTTIENSTGLKVD